MLRFEAKYGAAMLQKHFGITDLSYSPELLYRFLQESSCILCKAMQDCFPAGTYYSLAAVQEQLAQAGKSVQRERLGTWIAQTSRMGSACKARRALCAELSGSQYDALMKYQRASGIESGNNRPQVETAGTAESAECVRLCRITGVSNNRTTNPIGIVQHRTQAGETPAYRATILAFLHFHFGTNTVQ